MLASRRMATWSLTAELPAEEADASTALLFERGAAGVEEREAGLAPMPGERQPGSGRVILIGFFADEEAARGAATALPVPADLAEIPDRDWGEEWKKGLGPVSVGRLFLRPSWIDAAPPPGAAEVVLDPGMAFGTGTHATTSLCLSAIDDFLSRRPGASVLDVGTGSGLLAIAARKLGAGRVAANDNDPVALAVATENAERNRAALELTGDPPSAIAGAFDLVVANILANVLVELAPDLVRRTAPGGEVVLAGVLVPQEAEVARAFLACGLSPLPGDRRGEWSLLRFRRPEGR
jgi:ribosomal protein L11 methyltransferase